MKQRVICLLTLTLVVLAAAAQKSQDFAQKFVTLCKSDTTVRCVTVSPKMMEQLAAHQTDAHPDEITEAIGKLKSARIVTASASHYEKAEKLLKKNARRFKQQDNFQTSEGVRGAFYTRQDSQGQTVELIMLRQDDARDRLTIVCLTGDIDQEFLCFLYKNKSFKD